MNENSGTAHLSSRPDLLNIDREYADNLKILLDNNPSKGLEQLKVASVCNDEKNDLISKRSNGITPSSTILSKKGPSLLVMETTTSEEVTVPERDRGLKSIPEEAVSSYYKDNITNGVSFDQDSVRTFHTTLFLGNNAKPPNSTDLGKAVKVSTPAARSKSFGRKNMSARIQSLLEHFESSDRNFNYSSSLPEIPRNIEKRPAKQPSPEASMSENKSSAEACFACNKVIYPLDRYSTGSHVYHKSCLRCSVCDRSLSGVTCESSKGKLFCRPHFLEKAHGIFRRLSTPVTFSCESQNVEPYSIAVEYI
ncbi:flavoprotein oxidoreductase [Echinococcus multilocularis]|uniref:Flavoprotein oxidoreductase n=1 Tax=Echinococcus multilocularis TaxID=6211 RepID=A0A068YBN6_ECHMU|nr:flavoprotein oxidoreductase [Echinococcus multilocularis]